MNVLVLAILAASPARHGTWIYPVGTQTLTQAGISVGQVIDTATRYRLTEVYVSLRALPPEDAATIGYIRMLKQAGLRVEALLSDPNVETAIKRVTTYNDTQMPDARFDGIHYDFEPWIGTGNDTSWVTPLLDVYTRACAAIAGTGMTLAADISAPKYDMLTPAQRSSLLLAAGRLTMMAYEMTLSKLYERADVWMAAAACTQGDIVIAIRTADFGSSRCSLGAQFIDFENRYGNSPQFAGTAVFSFGTLQ